MRRSPRSLPASILSRRETLRLASSGILPLLSEPESATGPQPCPAPPRSPLRAKDRLPPGRRFTRGLSRLRKAFAGAGGGSGEGKERGIESRPSSTFRLDPPPRGEKTSRPPPFFSRSAVRIRPPSPGRRSLSPPLSLRVFGSPGPSLQGFPHLLLFPADRRPAFPSQAGGSSGRGAMAGTVVKVDGTEVAPEGPQPTTINITLRQESGLAYLCKGVAALGLRKAAAKDAGEAPRAPRPAGGGEQKVLGGAQILLGAVCIGLGVALSMLLPNNELPYDYTWAIYNGVAFWMGGLFMLSGTFSVVGARRGGYWVPLATFLNLGSVVTGSVAFTLGLTEFAPLHYEPYFIENLCKHRAEDRGYRSWELTTRPPYDDERDQQRAKECQQALLGFVRMLGSTQILLLIVHVAALATALFCFGYGLRRLCCSCWGGWQDYVALEDRDVSPAPEDPGKEQSPA